MRRQGAGNDFAAEIGRAGFVQQVEQHVAREHVNAHRGDERFRRIEGAAVKEIARRRAAANLAKAVGIGLLFEPHDAAFAIEPEDAHARRVGRRHGQRGHGDVGVFVDVRVEQPSVVHPIEMIACENQVVVAPRGA